MDRLTFSEAKLLGHHLTWVPHNHEAIGKILTSLGLVSAGSRTVQGWNEPWLGLEGSSLKSNFYSVKARASPTLRFLQARGGSP